MPLTPVRRWSFLGVISTGLFLIGLDNSVLYTALPALREHFLASETQALWMINAYPLVMTGLLLGTGSLGDRIGHRRMFELGMTVFLIASLLAAFAPSTWVFIAARALLGFGAATMMPATLALIRTTFTLPRELNVAIGVWSSVAVVGAAAGPVVGGLLLEHFWWGSIFLLNVPFGLLALAALPFLGPANIVDRTRVWDVISSGLALLTLGPLIVAIKTVTIGAFLTAGLSLVITLMAAWLFVRRQRGLEEPLLDFSVFKDSMFSGGVIAAAGALFTLAGIELLTTQRFQLIAGFSPLQAGLVVASAAASAAPAAIIGGAFLHRLGFRTIITGGFLSMLIGVAVAITAFANGENLPFFVIGLVFIGAGAGWIMSVASTAIIGSAPPTKAGMASGVEEVSYEFGNLLAVAILGSLWPALSVASTSGGDDRGYVATMGITVVILVLLIAASLWFFKGNPKTVRYEE